MKNLAEWKFPGFDKLDPYFVGYDRLWDEVNRFNKSLAGQAMQNYPPYNIKKTGDNTYVIEMAVAGFGRNDIELVLENGVLKVTGNANVADENVMNVLHKGIAERGFTRTFKISDTMEIKNADMLNGMLRVWLENIIPEHKKPKKIPISNGEEKMTELGFEDKEKEFLTEKA